MAILATTVTSFARGFGNRWRRSPNRERPPVGGAQREMAPPSAELREGPMEGVSTDDGADADDEEPSIYGL
eukprot:2755826-Alexandrium_andersonii.AAC.1